MTPTDDAPAAGQRAEGKAASSSSPSSSSSSASGPPSSTSSSSPSGSSGARPRKETASEGGQSSSGSGSRPGSASGSHRRREEGLGTEPVRFLIGLPPQPWSMGAPPVDLDFVARALEADEEISVLRRLAPRPPVRTFPGLDSGGPAIIAAEMPLGRAEALARHLQLVVEIDSPLEPAGSNLDAMLSPAVPVRLPGRDPVDVLPFYGSPL